MKNLISINIFSKKYCFYLISFFFKQIVFYKLNKLEFFFLKKSFNFISELIISSFSSKKKFLIIDDFSKKSNWNSLNYLIFSNVRVSLKFLSFFFKKSKLRSLFYVFLKRFILMNNICFLVFINDTFYKAHLSFFSKIFTPRVCCFNLMNQIVNCDYKLYIPNKLIHKNIFYMYIFNILKFTFFYNTSVKLIRSSNLICINV